MTHLRSMPGKNLEMRAYLEAMRPERWPRSLAIFVGSAAFFFLNHTHFQSSELLWLLSRLSLAFLITWAISTANYIINEIADAPYDRHHPTKKHRPLLQGKIRIGPFLSLGSLLILGSLAIAWLCFSTPFFISLTALLIAGFIYNIKPVRTKDIPFIDSISESANNPIRFLIGWFTFASAHYSLPLSLLLCWWSFGNFLMVAKRLSEFRYLTDKAGDYRLSLKRYSQRSLLFGMGISAGVFFITYFIFALRFDLPSFLFLSPFVFLYFFLFLKKTLQEKEVMEEPELLLRQPIFALYTLILAAAFFIAFLLDTAK